MLSITMQMMNSVFCISDDSFVVGSSFELLFSIRPRNLNGLLLHVGDSSKSQYGPAMGHYLSVYMLRGEVRPTVCQFNDATSVFFCGQITLTQNFSFRKLKNWTESGLEKHISYIINLNCFSTGGLFQNTLP